MSTASGLSWKIITTQNGGSVRGDQAIFVPLAAPSSPCYSPMGGQPAVYFSLSHKP